MPGGTGFLGESFPAWRTVEKVLENQGLLLFLVGGGAFCGRLSGLKVLLLVEVGHPLALSLFKQHQRQRFCTWLLPSFFDQL